MGFLTCRAMRMQVMQDGVDGLEGLSYAVGPEPSRKPKKSWFARRREENARRAQETEQRDVDRILAKVAESGMNSLTSAEKRRLKQATVNQQKRDAERARRVR
jgi:hypothetical protein